MQMGIVNLKDWASYINVCVSNLNGVNYLSSFKFPDFLRSVYSSSHLFFFSAASSTSHLKKDGKLRAIWLWFVSLDSIRF
jgi:hypothetical protein